tara:strand:+ start:242 stop:526 length:285 start_codon:yes stop_codon:yes gene_type:complete
MNKGISEDAQIHISIAFLIKAMVAVGIVVGSWYQAQMKFANIETKLEDLHDKVIVLTASVEGMEQEHIQELETAKVQLEEENKSLMQRLGLKRP